MVAPSDDSLPEKPAKPQNGNGHANGNGKLKPVEQKIPYHLMTQTEQYAIKAENDSKSKKAKKGDRSLRRKYRLRLKEYRFVRAYLGRANGNGTEAMKLAGYRLANDGVYASSANRLLNNGKIQRLIEHLLNDEMATNGDIERCLTSIINANPADWMDIDDDGKERLSLKKMKEAGALGLIESLSYDANRLPKIKLYSRLRAADTLSKIRGMITEKHEHSGTVTFAHKIVSDADIVAARQLASHRLIEDNS